MVNEHQLQKYLTRIWARNGVDLDGERHFLAAWEVMDDYRINSAQTGFGRPAIDFLLLNAEGNLAAVELKMSVRTPRDSWAVLCQVTRRAALLAQSFTPYLLESAHEACYSGRHGRIEEPSTIEDLGTAHARFFSRKPIGLISGLPIRRVVAAPDFGSRWDQTRDFFATHPRAEVEAEIARYSVKGWPGKEFAHWRELPTPPATHLAPSISTLNVPTSLLETRD